VFKLKCAGNRCEYLIEHNLQCSDHGNYCLTRKLTMPLYSTIRPPYKLLLPVITGTNTTKLCRCHFLQST